LCVAAPIFVEAKDAQDHGESFHILIDFSGAWAAFTLPFW
jgi:hypothetical protein